MCVVCARVLAIWHVYGRVHVLYTLPSVCANALLEAPCLHYVALRGKGDG